MKQTAVEIGTPVTDHFATWLLARGEQVTDLYAGTAPVWRSCRGTADILRQAYYAEHPSLL